MRLCGLGERERLVDHDLQLASTHPRHERRDHRVRALGVHHHLGAEEHARDRGVLLHQRPHGRRSILATCLTDPADAPAVRERRDAALQRLAADGIDDEVDAAPVRQPPHLGLDARRGVVDAVVEAEVCEAGQAVVGRRGGEHRGAGRLRELDGGQADTTCAGLHEHRLAGLQVTELEQAVVRRAELDRDAGGDRGGHAGRRHPRGTRRHADELGMRPVAHRGHDRVTDRHIGDPVADLEHDACGLVADDMRCRGEDAALAVQQVTTLDADRLHLHEQAAGAHDRVGDVFVAEHVRSAGLVEHRCLHGSTVALASATSSRAPPTARITARRRR